MKRLHNLLPGVIQDFKLEFLTEHVADTFYISIEVELGILVGHRNDLREVDYRDVGAVLANYQIEAIEVSMYDAHLG